MALALEKPSIVGAYKATFIYAKHCPLTARCTLYKTKGKLWSDDAALPLDVLPGCLVKRSERAAYRLQIRFALLKL